MSQAIIHCESKDFSNSKGPLINNTGNAELNRLAYAVSEHRPAFQSLSGSVPRMPQSSLGTSFFYSPPCFENQFPTLIKVKWQA